SLLETVDRAREMGWGISVDDIGTSLGCLSVLPLVHADVVKLDVRMLDDELDTATSEVVAAVLRHIEATGAALVVKGIEDERDERLALALGARYGQGHHLGVPGLLERGDPMPRAVVPLLGRGRGVPEGRSPFEILANLDRRRVTSDLLRRLAQIFTLRALRSGSRPVVLIGAGNRTPGDLASLDGGELARLAEQSVLVVVFGVGLPAEPAPGVRGVALCARDPLVGERFMAVLTDTFSFAMSARRGTGGLFELVTTQEPHRVGDVAQHLLRRTPSAGGPNQAQPVPVPDVDLAEEEPEVEDGADDTVTAGPLMRRWRAKVRR
ncbi:phytochrome-like protein cph2, partial [Cellulomonas bogoriensis 69B4 = DSM 16987]